MSRASRRCPPSTEPDPTAVREEPLDRAIFHDVFFRRLPRASAADHGGWRYEYLHWAYRYASGFDPAAPPGDRSAAALPAHRAVRLDALLSVHLALLLDVNSLLCTMLPGVLAAGAFLQPAHLLGVRGLAVFDSSSSPTHRPSRRPSPLRDAAGAPNVHPSAGNPCVN